MQIRCDTDSIALLLILREADVHTGAEMLRTFVVHTIVVFTLTYIGKLFVIMIVWHQSYWRLTLVVVNVIV